MTVMRLGAAIAMIAGILASAAASAGTLPKPTGPVILTVTGAIENTNADGAAEFDRAMLAALPQGAIVTETPWDEGKGRYEGVRADALMAAVGARGTDVLAAALNDYKATVPIADFAAHGVILADRKDGKELTVRTKGPLFIVYPFDDEPGLRDEVIFHRSVWQLRSLDVR